jgi:spermidine synthase
MTNDQDTRRRSLPFYLVLSFIEGGAAMAAELLGARMIAPFYGTTLFVWSSVIGVTLAALALGYFLGGYLADRYTRNMLLFSVLAVGSVLLALMPNLAKFSLEATSGMGIRTGSLVSALVFLLPPLVCLGMSSPIIIRLASRDLQHTGRTAGTVYAVSTVSGILATFLLGFHVIPLWGITMPAYYAAVLLGIFPFGYFIRSRRFAFALAMIILFSIPALASTVENKSQNQSEWKILYKSDGLLGQVIVGDLQRMEKDSLHHQRTLFVNRQPQTNVNAKNGFSLWPYVHAMAVTASMRPRGSTALVLGLGGGSVVDEFLRLGFEVDACELDERIVDVAKTFFNLDKKCRIVVDDARHYVRTSRERYDIIVFDTFSGEQPPAHILSVENFSEVKRILNGDGLVIINFSGFITGEAGLASRSIIRTMISSGFHTKVISTPGTEESRNLVFVGSVAPLDFSRMTRERQNICCTVPVPLPCIDAGAIDLSDALVLTDDKPILDILSLSANESWRKSVVKESSKAFHGYQLFF